MNDIVDRLRGQEPPHLGDRSAAADVIERLRAELAECRRQRLASTVVTYEVASSVFGDRPQLTDDCTRRAFFAVWALAIKELAEALAQE